MTATERATLERVARFLDNSAALMTRVQREAADPGIARDVHRRAKDFRAAAAVLREAQQ